MGADLTAYWLLIGTHWLNIVVTSATQGISSSSFKLSDLPVLQHWQVPWKYRSKKSQGGYIGRRHKDLIKDYKRSAHWELRPDFNARELDFEEDPEKIQLDFNYKCFIEGLEDEDEAGESSRASRTRRGNSGSDFNLMEENHESKAQKSLVAKKNTNKASRTRNGSKRQNIERNRRSLDDDDKKLGRHMLDSWETNHYEDDNENDQGGRIAKRSENMNDNFKDEHAISFDDSLPPEKRYRRRRIDTPQTDDQTIRLKRDEDKSSHKIGDSFGKRRNYIEIYSVRKSGIRKTGKSTPLIKRSRRNHIPHLNHSVSTSTEKRRSHVVDTNGKEWMHQSGNAETPSVPERVEKRNIEHSSDPSNLFSDFTDLMEVHAQVHNKKNIIHSNVDNRNDYHNMTKRDQRDQIPNDRMEHVLRTLEKRVHVINRISDSMNKIAKRSHMMGELKNVSKRSPPSMGFIPQQRLNATGQRSSVLRHNPIFVARKENQLQPFLLKQQEKDTVHSRSPQSIRSSIEKHQEKPLPVRSTQNIYHPEQDGRTRRSEIPHASQKELWRRIVSRYRSAMMLRKNKIEGLSNANVVRTNGNANPMRIGPHQRLSPYAMLVQNDKDSLAPMDMERRSLQEPKNAQHKNRDVVMTNNAVKRSHIPHPQETFQHNNRHVIVDNPVKRNHILHPEENLQHKNRHVVIADNPAKRNHIINPADNAQHKNKHVVITDNPVKRNHIIHPDENAQHKNKNVIVTGSPLKRNHMVHPEENGQHKNKNVIVTDNPVKRNHILHPEQNAQHKNKQALPSDKPVKRNYIIHPEEFLVGPKRGPNINNHKPGEKRDNVILRPQAKPIPEANKLNRFVKGIKMMFRKNELVEKRTKPNITKKSNVNINLFNPFKKLFPPAVHHPRSPREFIPNVVRENQVVIRQRVPTPFIVEQARQPQITKVDDLFKKSDAAGMNILPLVSTVNTPNFLIHTTQSSFNQPKSEIPFQTPAPALNKLDNLPGMMKGAVEANRRQLSSNPIFQSGIGGAVSSAVHKISNAASSATNKISNAMTSAANKIQTGVVNNPNKVIKTRDDIEQIKKQIKSTAGGEQKTFLVVPRSQIVHMAKLAIRHPHLLNVIKKASGILNTRSKVFHNGTGSSTSSEINQTNEVKKLIGLLKDKKVGAAEASKRTVIAKPDSGSQNPATSYDADKIGKAVSLAIKQLKRDKMWGQVYVSVVPPKGKVRVVIQETTKHNEGQ